jgi:hypothetical protein
MKTLPFIRLKYKGEMMMRENKEHRDIVNRYLKINFNVIEQTSGPVDGAPTKIIVTKGIECTPEQITKKFYD